MLPDIVLNAFAAITVFLYSVVMAAAIFQALKNLIEEIREWNLWKR